MTIPKNVNHKDSLSRLSEAIEQIKNYKQSRKSPTSDYSKLLSRGSDLPPQKMQIQSGELNIEDNEEIKEQDKKQ